MVHPKIPNNSFFKLLYSIVEKFSCTLSDIILSLDFFKFVLHVTKIISSFYFLCEFQKYSSRHTPDNKFERFKHLYSFLNKEGVLSALTSPFIVYSLSSEIIHLNV